MGGSDIDVAGARWFSVVIEVSLGVDVGVFALEVVEAADSCEGDARVSPLRKDRVEGDKSGARWDFRLCFSII